MCVRTLKSSDGTALLPSVKKYVSPQWSSKILSIHQISIKHHKECWDSELTINNSFSCFIWVQLDGKTSIGFIKRGGIVDTSVSFSWFQFFFFFLILCWGFLLCLFKAAFSSHEVGISWKSPFHTHGGTHEDMRNGYFMFFRLLTPRQCSMFTI